MSLAHGKNKTRTYFECALEFGQHLSSFSICNFSRSASRKKLKFCHEVLSPRRTFSRAQAFKSEDKVVSTLTANPKIWLWKKYSVLSTARIFQPHKHGSQTQKKGHPQMQRKDSEMQKQEDPQTPKKEESQTNKKWQTLQHIRQKNQERESKTLERCRKEDSEAQKKT